MESEALLTEISGFCRRVGMAESTFGRLAVNDGKLVSRLRFGGRVRDKTVERVRAFIDREKQGGGGVGAPAQRNRTPTLAMPVPMAASAAAAMASQPRLATAVTTPAPGTAEPTDKNFRFFDNRQKYLLFVNTCSEKWVVAERVALELANIHPRPPGLRIFDAGVGDGTVLTRVMRAMHERFPTMPSLYRRQGDQPRGRASRAREDAGPLLRASGDGAGPHQHVLFRGAVADAEFGDRRDQPRLARG